MPLVIPSDHAISAWSTLLFSALLGIAAVWDVRTRRIPNRLVLGVGLAGLIVSAFGLAAPDLWHSIAGSAVGLGIWFPLFAIGALGAGDVKLFAAAAAWLGPERTLAAALYAALLGGVLAVAWMLRTNGVSATAGLFAARGLTVRRPTLDPHSRRAIPYGVALAAGAAGAAWFPRLLGGG